MANKLKEPIDWLDACQSIYIGILMMFIFVVLGGSVVMALVVLIYSLGWYTILVLVGLAVLLLLAYWIGEKMHG